VYDCGIFVEYEERLMLYCLALCVSCEQQRIAIVREVKCKLSRKNGCCPHCKQTRVQNEGVAQSWMSCSYDDDRVASACTSNTIIIIGTRHHHHRNRERRAMKRNLPLLSTRSRSRSNCRESIAAPQST
jgi:hypothetical protein